MAVGWAPNRLKAGPNGSGVNRLDTDDILAPHSQHDDEIVRAEAVAP